MSRTCTTCGNILTGETRFCGRCGAAVPEGAAPEGAAPEAAPEAAVPAAGADPTLILAPESIVGHEPPRPKAGRRMVATAAIVAGLAALGVTGALLLRSGSTGTGSDSPDAAVRRFVAAIEKRDIVGAFQATAPDELRGAGDIYKASVDKSREIGLLADGDPLGGLTLDIADVKLEVSSLSGDLARVTVSDGKITWAVDPNGFPVGEKYRSAFSSTFESATPDELGGTVEIPEETGESPILYTVRRGGRWYVSLYSTITHYIGFNPADAADDDAKARGKPAASPEAALRALLDGAAALDVDGVLNAIAPAESRIARIYERYIRDAFDEARSYNPRITIGSPSLETESIDGSRAKVWINTLSVDVESTDTGSFHVAIDRSCATMRANGESERFCLSDAGIDQFLHLIPDRAFVVAVKDDNGWYVSTVETMFELVRHTISAVRQSDIDAFMDAMSGLSFDE